MFCVQCGNQLEDGAKFCAGCGTRVDGGTSELLRAIQSASAWLTRKKRARVLAALISVLIITTLFLGWVSIHIRPGSFIPQSGLVFEFLPREIKSMLNADIYFTVTTYDLNNYARALESISNVIGTSGLASADVTSALNSASNALGLIGFIRFMSMICVLSLAVFLSLMTGNSKKAGLAGQAATLLTFLISLVFAISVSIINSRLPDVASRGISVSASGWVYATIILGAAGFLLITLCKGVINEE
jgi:hypothetical protein